MSATVTRKTSYSLPAVLSDALDNHPVAAVSIHHFTIDALDAYIASKPSPMKMTALCRAMDTLVERECPKTFCPPAILGKPLHYYKAIAASLKVSLSALIANAVAAALQMHPAKA